MLYSPNISLARTRLISSASSASSVMESGFLANFQLFQAWERREVSTTQSVLVGAWAGEMSGFVEGY